MYITHIHPITTPLIYTYSHTEGSVSQELRLPAYPHNISGKAENMLKSSRNTVVQEFTLDVSSI